MEMVRDIEELGRLIEKGENSQIEFKMELSESVLQNLPSKICAFANSQGGMIVFGVTDWKEPIGIKFGSKERDSISQAAAACRPPVQIEIDELSFGAKNFSIINIPKGRVIHSTPDGRFPIRIGSITENLDAIGLVPLMQERGLVGSTPVQSDIYTPVSSKPGIKRKQLPEENLNGFITILKGGNRSANVIILREISSQLTNNVILEKKELILNIFSILQNPSDEELYEILEIVRSVNIWGTEREKENIVKWQTSLLEIGKNSLNPQLARRAFESLMTYQDSKICDVLVYWIINSNDEYYNQVQPRNALGNAGHYGLKPKIRDVMYDLLSKEKDERTIKRVSEILEQIRYG